MIISETNLLTLKMLGGIPVVLIGVYLLFRLASAAIYQSKLYYERRKNGQTKTE